MIVDLFCGAGGASEGIRQALDRSPDLAIDGCALACCSHSYNHKSKLICADIGKIGAKKIKKYTEGKDIELLWASPPCTEFSRIKLGEKNKDIAELVYTPLTWIENASVENLIIENVLDLRNYDQYNILLDKLSKRFRRVETHIVKHRDCGGATMRERLFIIARNTNFNLCFDKQKSKPAQDYLDEKNVAWKPLISKDVRFMAAIDQYDPLGILGEDFFCSKTLFPCAYPITGLFPTITTKSYHQACLISADKTHYRLFSAIELARLQGLYGFYFCEFVGADKIIKQIGNAVPPSMAKTVVEALKLDKGAENER
ncbi:MAG: DNA cytosine methyltransferase [Helicobacteraceae bacterium]|jgi:site-specific DNA-cytosine methylase|nr:DNA cytosine methyltransferase [Helicobacteraceae bacterium]